LTKVHEEYLRGPLSLVLARLGEPRGEFTVVLAAAATQEPAAPDLDDRRARGEFEDLTAQGGLSRREAVATLARRYARPAREIYAAIERGKRAEE
jgi:16S rRNA C1402 (ribose-2'-O) methylase RsmI